MPYKSSEHHEWKQKKRKSYKTRQATIRTGGSGSGGKPCGSAYTTANKIELHSDLQAVLFTSDLSEDQKEKILAEFASGN